jgi:hypothetical protein
VCSGAFNGVWSASFRLSELKSDSRHLVSRLLDVCLRFSRNLLAISPEFCFIDVDIERGKKCTL